MICDSLDVRSRQKSYLYPLLKITKYISKISFSNQILNLGPTDVEANVSETVNLPCSILWDPSSDLEVIWRKDNINIDIDDQRIRIHESNKSLTINNLNHGDKGKQNCCRYSS